jgi:predicted DsbA family dithiol-disulfide isomerase
MITVDYFSDVLCVWAYGGQVRLDEVRRRFNDRILVRERFTPLFADTPTKIGDGWKDRGGYDGFGLHAREVCEQWPHTQLHPDVWTRCRPASSINAHLFLKAAALSMGIDDSSADGAARERYHGLVTRVRLAFFEQARDIACIDVLRDLLEDRDPAWEAILEHLQTGTAAAALHRDADFANTHGVRGSPTYVFNEGRQMLYGNVGFKIVEANLNELLSGRLTDGEPSWC